MTDFENVFHRKLGSKFVANCNKDRKTYLACCYTTLWNIWHLLCSQWPIGLESHKTKIETRTDFSIRTAFKDHTNPGSFLARGSWQTISYCASREGTTPQSEWRLYCGVYPRWNGIHDQIRSRRWMFWNSCLARDCRRHTAPQFHTINHSQNLKI